LLAPVLDFEKMKAKIEYDIALALIGHFRSDPSFTLRVLMQILLKSMETFPSN